MNWKLKAVAALWAALISVSVAGQCTEDSQCAVGYYCEQHSCRQCLSCSGLRREELAPRETCVRSILECGPCFEGLEDLRLDGGCVEKTPEASGSLPAYIWALISLGVVFIVLMIAFLLVVFKKDDIMHILKKRATGSALAEGAAPPPDAPPPPYNEEFTTDYWAEPGPLRTFNPVLQFEREEEVAQPFIKRAGSWRGAGAREAAGAQEARPFSNPAYIRGPPSVIHSDDSEPPGSPFPPPDEETMESPWTPNEPSNTNDNNNTNAQALVPAAAGVRRRASDDTGPPSKALCLRQDSDSEPEGAGEGSAAAPVTVVINNVTNISLPRL